jgi:hypothetical protein
MNVIDYITITCNQKKVWLQITSDYMKKCNRLQLITITITITPCLLHCIYNFGVNWIRWCISNIYIQCIKCKVPLIFSQCKFSYQKDMFIIILFTGKLCNEVFTDEQSFSPLLYCSPETQYIFTESLLLLIRWKKQFMGKTAKLKPWTRRQQQHSLLCCWV